MATTAPRNRANKRLYLLAGILVLWAGGICLRLVYLQIFRYGDFEQRAQRQQQRTTEVAAKRGIIYDRAGRELAMSVSVDSVFAVPADIPDLAGTISLVARITKADPRELLAKCQSARDVLLGRAQGGCRNRGPHPLHEPARHLFSEGIQAVLSQT